MSENHAAHQRRQKTYILGGCGHSILVDLDKVESLGVFANQNRTFMRVGLGITLRTNSALVTTGLMASEVYP